MSTALSIRELHKSFGPNEVLRGVDLDFEAGEVHALLGPNGAGKSTLLGCLSGATRPDGGSIVVGRDTHQGFTPQEAFAAGTAIIYQHFQLIDDLTVVDNLFLGGELVRGTRTLRKSDQLVVANEVLSSLGADFDASQSVSTLSVGQRQLVEIAKAIRHRPTLLILDEPTAALSGDEAQILLALVRRLAREEGIAVVYVTHLLREVLSVSDRVTVLRDGEVLWTRPTSDLDLTDLISAISPAPDLDVLTRQPGGGRAADAATTTLVELEGFAVGGSAPIDLTLGEGEIVGVFGLLGSGRTNLVEGMAGIRRTSEGALRIAGQVVDTSSPARARRGGVVLVASDRKAQSLFGSMTAIENLLMPHFGWLSRPFRRRAREAKIFSDVSQLVNLQPERADLEAESFSGGNAQKIAVGRWLGELGNPRLMILDEPTQGVDVGSREEIYNLLRSFAGQERKAVLFVSSDPDEILTLADRIVVLVDSAVAGTLPADTDEKELMALAHADATTQSKGLSHV